MRHVVVMVATSYPRFPGDGIASFMEPIAKGVAARGHEVHLVAPWHPAIRRPKAEDGVFFHFFRYAPVGSLAVFGYASGLRADTRLRAAAWAVAPAAVAAGTCKTWRVATKRRATVVHGHWVVPGGVIALAGAGRRPLVVSLHGSDVFVAERSGAARVAARTVFRQASWITACSDDLRTRAIALGADPGRSETIPYGVDVARFAPDPGARDDVRAALGVGRSPLVAAAGRLVSKKGFEYLIDAVGRLLPELPDLTLVIAGDGDLREALAARASRAGGRAIRLLGAVPQDEVARLTAAADVVVVPSIRDDAGNVDGLPNVALEALATGRPVVGTTAGGLPQAITDGVNGRLVPERDANALAAAIRHVLQNKAAAEAMGAAARRRVEREFGWPRVAERLEQIYDRAAGARS
jgi:glycosyltransferase involved in cell wall biosynthesis